LQFIYGDAFRVPLGDSRIIEDHARKAVENIRRKALFQDVPIVSIPENAPAGIGSQLHRYLEDMPGVITMAEYSASDDTLGVPSANEHRNQQTEDLAHLFRNGGLSFSEQFSTHHECPTDKFQDQMVRQALGWERCAVMPKDPTKPVTWHWSAKHTCGNDDIIITMLMLAYWPSVFRKKPRYTQFITDVINGGDNGRYMHQAAHLPTALSDISKSDMLKRFLPSLNPMTIAGGGGGETGGGGASAKRTKF
jgi:hypothetical protein